MWHVWEQFEVMTCSTQFTRVRRTMYTLTFHYVLIASELHDQ